MKTLRRLIDWISGADKAKAIIAMVCEQRPERSTRNVEPFPASKDGEAAKSVSERGSLSLKRAA